jgi:hypothetical protein
VADREGDLPVLKRFGIDTASEDSPPLLEEEEDEEE